VTEITHTPPHANLRVADQAGQLACFNCVIETYQTQAYNLARRMLSDWALAAGSRTGLALRWRAGRD